MFSNLTKGFSNLNLDGLQGDNGAPEEQSEAVEVAVANAQDQASASSASAWLAAR